MYQLMSSINLHSSIKREPQNNNDLLDTCVLNSKNSKRSKIDLIDIQCEFCSRTFANSANLKQHMESFHSKTTTWSCSECKKVFSSKSNLKVHLRVHTKIKPYHCISCNYSCMHHSSIKEHLSRQHPNIVHSSTNPAYVYNSTTVPDPEQFNSSQFNREAFIAEAKEANEKLVEKIYFKNKINSSLNISPVSKSSTDLAFHDTTQDISFNTTNQSISISSNEDSEIQSFNHSPLSDPEPTNKFSNFSISSLIGLDQHRPNSKNLSNEYHETNNLNDHFKNFNTFYYNNQMQFFYALLCQMQLKGQN